MPGPQRRFTERTMILLSPEQRRWAESEADRRGISLAQLIREALEEKRERGR